METIKDRLIQIAKAEALSIRAFEERCGLGRGNISNMGPDSAIGSDKVTKILDTFPTINLHWLLTGSASETASPAKPEGGTNTVLLEKVVKQAEEIGRLKERIAQLEQRLEKTAGDASTGDIANVG